MKTLPQYLKDRGLAQRHFASLVKISPSHLSEIISGAKTPSLEYAVRISLATDRQVPEMALLPQHTLRANGWEPVQKVRSADE